MAQDNNLHVPASGPKIVLFSPSGLDPALQAEAERDEKVILVDFDSPISTLGPEDNRTVPPGRRPHRQPVTAAQAAARRHQSGSCSSLPETRSCSERPRPADSGNGLAPTRGLRAGRRSL
ncbi:MAG: hypothetical protein ACYCUC_16155 [Candidatus Dormibacteria bacterium]